MKTTMSFDFSIDIPDCKIDTIIAAFKKVLPLFLSEFTKEILEEYAMEVMSWAVKPFSCEICGNNGHFIRKTMNAKPTTIITIFGEIVLGQIQIQSIAANSGWIFLTGLP